MKYKNREISVNEIADDLNVGIILEGSVRKEKDRIRVTAQLIDTHTEEHLWAETYDDKYDHIFDLQNDIAFKVAHALEITLKDMEKNQRSLSLDSNYVYTYAYLGQTYAIQGMLNEAEEAFRHAAKLTESKDPATLAGLAYVYAIQNKTGEATAILTQLKNLGDGFYVHPTYLAIIYMALGNREETLDWLERGYQDRSEWMIYLQVEHMLDPLRGEERFVELTKKMNFKKTKNNFGNKAYENRNNIFFDL